MMLKENHIRSITRSILWRIMGVIVLAIITYIFTQSWIQTGLITFLHHFVFVFIYYFHERAWQKIHKIQGKRRKVLRAFTYEIILGHFVLGFITLTVTGSWTNVTLITIFYIENKLWLYYLYDWVWDRIKWQSQNEKVF